MSNYEREMSNYGRDLKSFIIQSQKLAHQMRELNPDNWQMRGLSKYFQISKPIVKGQESKRGDKLETISNRKIRNKSSIQKLEREYRQFMEAQDKKIRQSSLYNQKNQNKKCPNCLKSDAVSKQIQALKQKLQQSQARCRRLQAKLEKVQHVLNDDDQ